MPAPDPRATELSAILERSRELGFLGPGPVAAHLEHTQPLVGLLREHVLSAGQVHAVDLGTGGGVPGLLLAAAFPSWRWVLLDAMERRTAFLATVVQELDWSSRVTVLRERAEIVGRDPSCRATIDVVTARSFAPPAVTAECAAPLLRPGGLMVVSEPPATTGTRWDASGLAALGFDPTPVVTGPWIAFRLHERCPDTYPRPVGRPAKRPLWVV